MLSAIQPPSTYVIPVSRNCVTRNVAPGPIPADADDVTADFFAAELAKMIATPIFGSTGSVGVVDSAAADDDDQDDETDDGPFARAHHAYRTAGLAGRFPLPARRKSPPPTNYTGRNGHCANDDEIAEWLTLPKFRNANIGLWLGISVVVAGVTYQVVGIDVDHYTSGTGDSAKVKLGGDQLAELATKLGPLPQTWISSARTDGRSGIRFFLAPHEIEFRDRADKDIEVIQAKHRYAVVWPSLHPGDDGDDGIDAGTRYWWFRPDAPLTEEGRTAWNPDTDELPNVADLPVLPDSWVVYLTTHRSYAADPDYSASVAELRQFADDMFNDGSEDEICWNVDNALSTWKRQITNEATSHDKITDAHWMLFRLAAEGHTGWKHAVGEIEAHWADDVIGRGKRALSEAHAEVFRSWTGALRKIKAAVERDGVADKCDCAAAGANLPNGMGARVWHSDRVPLAVARQLALLNEREERPIHRWRGDWYQYDGGRWKRLDDDQFNASLYGVLETAMYVKAVKANGVVVKYEPVPWNPDESKIRKVSHALRSVVLLDSEDVVPPCWLDGTDEHVIAFRNCLLQVADRKQLDPTPKFFNTTVLPFDFDPAAPVPRRWLEFVNEVFPGDAEAVAALQEWFGYVISGRTNLHKMLTIIGIPRSGKGTISMTLQKLVGNENVAGGSPDDLTERFGKENLIGKTLAVFDDQRVARNGKKFVDILKGITGEVKMPVDRKNKTEWNGRLSTRFVYIANEGSPLPDNSGAIIGRMVVLETRESFEGKEDRELEVTLEDELPGIYLWALDGLDRLKAQGRFTHVTSSEDLVRRLRDAASPIMQYADDRLIFDPGDDKAFVTDEKLYEVWKLWCQKNNYVAGNKAAFLSKLTSAYGSRIEHKRRGGRNTQAWGFLGVRLQNETDAPDRIVIGVDTRKEPETGQD